MGTVLFISPFDFKSVGFTSRVYPIGKALENYHFDAIYYSTGCGSHPIEATHSGISKLGQNSFGLRKPLVKLPPELHQNFSSILYFVLGRFMPPIFRPADIIVTLRGLSVTKNDVIAVVCQKPFFRTVIPALKLSSELSIPCILDIDDYDVSNKAPFLSLFDAITVASNTLMREFRAWNPIFLPNVPSIKSVESEINLGLESKYADTVFIYPKTGIPISIAVKAISSILPSNPNSHLRLVAFPPSIIRNLPVNPNRNVYSYPQVSHNALMEMLGSCQISVCLDPDSRYGNAKSSIRLIESLYKGCAILAWNRGETGEIVEKSGSGIAVPYGDFDQLRKAYLKLVTDTSFRQSCQRQGLVYLKSLGDWNENIKPLIEVIRRNWEYRRGPSTTSVNST